MPRENLHTFAARIRRAIAGDRDAAERYERLGRTADAEASRASAERWEADLRSRLTPDRKATCSTSPTSPRLRTTQPS